MTWDHSAYAVSFPGVNLPFIFLVIFDSKASFLRRSCIDKEMLVSCPVQSLIMAKSYGVISYVLFLLSWKLKLCVQTRLNGSRCCLETFGDTRNIVLDRNLDFPHGFDAAFTKLLWPLFELVKFLSLCMSLSLRGFIWLLMMVWSKRGNINTAAVVTIIQCNTLVARCSRQLIGPADWVFVTLGPLRCA